MAFSKISTVFLSRVGKTRYARFSAQNPISRKNGFWLCDALASEPGGFGTKYFTGRYLYEFPIERYRSRGKHHLWDTGEQLGKYSPSKVEKTGERLVLANGQKKDQTCGLCGLFFWNKRGCRPWTPTIDSDSGLDLNSDKCLQWLEESFPQSPNVKNRSAFMTNILSSPL